MTMFPGAGAQVYYNEEGEPLGWDIPSDDPPDPDDFYEDDPLVVDAKEAFLTVVRAVTKETMGI